MNTNTDGNQERKQLMEIEYINGVVIVNGNFSIDGGEIITE